MQIQSFIYPNLNVQGKQTTLTCVWLHLTEEGKKKGRYIKAALFFFSLQ